jgi:hypothetical protein
MTRLSILTVRVKRNGIDCGLFAVGVVLHLLEGKAIDGKTFNPKDIHQLRLNLAPISVRPMMILQTPIVFFISKLVGLFVIVSPNSKVRPF